MSILGHLRNAALGWLELIGGQPSPAPRFSATGRGLVVVITAYLLVVLLRILIHGAVTTMPNSAELFLGMTINALPLLPVWAVAWVTLRLLKPDVPLLAVLVPAFWSMTILWLIGIPLSLISPIINNAILGMFGYTLFRIGRKIAGLGLTTAISYAILSILALVTLPLTLYMVMAPGEPGPI